MARKVRNEAQVPFEPEESTPLELYGPTHGNILAMMAESGFSSNEQVGRLDGETVEDDHAVSASLPLEHSAVDATGHMDHHRKPIISIHGKDVDERELDRKDAA